MCGPSHYALLEDGQVAIETLVPEDLGLKTVELHELQGGDPKENAKITEAILKGEEKGPKADLVAINAAAGLLVADKASSLQEGVGMAQGILESGKAYKKLEVLRS